MKNLWQMADSEQRTKIVNMIYGGVQSINGMRGLSDEKRAALMTDCVVAWGGALGATMEESDQIASAVSERLRIFNEHGSIIGDRNG